MSRLAALARHKSMLNHPAQVGYYDMLVDGTTHGRVSDGLDADSAERPGGLLIDSQIAAAARRDQAATAQRRAASRAMTASSIARNASQVVASALSPPICARLWLDEVDRSTAAVFVVARRQGPVRTTFP